MNGGQISRKEKDVIMYSKMMGDVGKRTYAKIYCKIKIGRTNTFQKETRRQP